MTQFYKVSLVALAGLGLAACATQTVQTERSAATGAAIGAVAGAVIGNNVGDGDAQTGAVIGAVLGGAAGAAKGCNDAEDCDLPGVKDQAYEKDADKDGYADAVDRYPTDPNRW